MPRFFYTAQDKYKAIVKGDLEAPGREDALAQLARRGLSPIQLYAGSDEKQGVSSKLSRDVSLFGDKLKIFDQITFIRHLGTLLSTGTDLITALNTIEEDTIKPVVRKMTGDVRNKITRGEMFSDALRSWEKHFNPIFLSLVKAGEASGTLPSVLLSYAQELRKDYTFSRKLKGALIYPAILITALIGMIVIILTFVIPRIKELFTSTSVEAPIYTKILFFASDIWRAFTPFIISGFILFFIVLIVALRNKNIRHRISLIAWYIPILNKIQKNLVLMRICKTIGSLLDAGFSLKSALSITSGVVLPNYQAALQEIADKKLERGVNFAQALHDYPQLFPGTFTSVIATGEKGGQLSKVLFQMAEFYEEEVAYSLEAFLTLIEPVLLVTVGLIVGLMASSLISPLYRLIGSIR